QTSFEQYLPTPEERSNLYQLGKKLFKSYGYNDIGMDHFATSDDRLYQAYDQGMLHRNFMGYTTQDTDLLVGLGMSAISDSWTAFSQNEKLISQYYERLDHNEFPIMKGHQLTHEDLLIRKHILNLMCKFKTRWSASELLEIGVGFNVSLLNDLTLDGLITWNENGIDVTEVGKPFIRNICMALDTRLWMHQKTNRFSQTL
ncbi:MAG: coproporphyrinogen III oxidase, partial [Marinoscillum sp.]